MPTKKKEPPSTNRYVEELKQFLLPTGVSGNQAELLMQVVERTIDLFTSLDGRERRFILMVLTREDNSAQPLVSTDVIADVDREVIFSTMREWLERCAADG